MPENRKLFVHQLAKLQYLFCASLLLIGAFGPAQTQSSWTIGLETGVSTLNPFTLSGWDSYRASTLSLETLADPDLTTGGLTPVLATHWEINKRRKAILVHLRPGVEFHDGTTMTAEDVKFTFDAYRDDRFEGAIWRPLWESVDSATIKNPKTIEFKMHQLKYDQFYGLLTQMRILPKSYYGRLKNSEWSDHIVGTGPYKLISFHPNTRMEFQYFAKWWGAKAGAPPLVQKLTLKTVSDRHLAAAMIRKGELALYPISDVALYLDLKKENDSKIRLLALSGLGGSRVGIDLNLSDPLLKSEKVRKALLMLWNRDALSKKVFGGEMKVAIDGFDEQAPGYPAGTPVPYDPSKARALLREEGWSDGGDGTLSRTVSGKTEAFVFPVTVDHPQNERWLTLYKEDAKKVGVDVRLVKIASDSQSWHRLKEKKFVGWAFSGGTDRAVTMIWKSDDYYNFYGFSDPAVDALLEKLNSEFDLGRRRAINSKLLLLLRPKIINLHGLYNPKTYFMTAPNVRLNPQWPYRAMDWTSSK